MSYCIKRPATAFAAPKARKGNRSPSYLSWLRTLPCCVCGSSGDVVAHHVRLERCPSGFRSYGMLGKRVPDFQCVPLRSDLHDGYAFSLHAGNEADWWRKKEINPMDMAEMLADRWEAGTRSIEDAHEAMTNLRNASGKVGKR